jgi:surface protein
MREMFYYATGFNQPLNHFNTENVTDMHFMLAGTENFNQPLNNWNVSNVKTMQVLFHSSSFNQDISSRDTANVERM